MRQRLLLAGLAGALSALGLTVSAPAVADGFHDSSFFSDAATGPGGTATGDIDLGGYKVLDSTAPLCLGSGACSSGHGLSAGTDVMTAGKLEVDGISYFDDNINAYGAINIRGGSAVSDNEELFFGSQGDIWFEYDEAVDDALELWTTDADGIGTDGPVLSADLGTDDVDFMGEVSIGGVTGSGKVVCVKADGDLGTCADQPGAGGTCTCN